MVLDLERKTELWFELCLQRRYFLAMVMLLRKMLSELGFTFAICKNVVLKGRNSNVIDSEGSQSFNPTYDAIHMSPRWGFRIFACPVCYKHAARWR